MSSSTKVVFDLLHLMTPMSHQGYETPQEVLTRIKFIGTIQAGEKLDTRNMRIEDNTIITPIRRMFFGEGRDTTYSFLHNTIERAFAILHSMASNEKISDMMMAANIMKDLDKAVLGLRNMQTTYKDDKMFVCNLETLMEAIDARMVEVKQKYPNIVKLATPSLVPQPDHLLFVPPIVLSNEEKIASGKSSDFGDVLSSKAKLESDDNKKKDGKK